LPFNVKDSETIFAGLVELSSEGLELAIFDDESQEEVAVSQMGKHFSTIDMVVLNRGNYYLVVKDRDANAR
jgi:hypothetical protein